MAEKKTLEQLKAEAEKAQKAYDNAKAELIKKEKEEEELKKAKLVAEKVKRKEELENAIKHYQTLMANFIKDYGSYYYEGDDDIYSFLFGSKPWRWFL